MDENKKEKKPVNKTTIIVIVVLVALAVVVGVFALLNREGVEEKRRLQDDAVFLVTAGEQSVEVSMEEIEGLGTKDVEANYKKSGKEPEVRTYTGVPFSEVLALKGIEADGYSSVTFIALDGYASAVGIDQALNPEECWIIIREGGEPLGTKEDGGSGPFRMILPNDQFSQNWCSFLMEAELRP